MPRRGVGDQSVGRAASSSSAISRAAMSLVNASSTASMSSAPASVGFRFTSGSCRYLAGCPATPSVERGAPGEEPARGIRLGQVDGGDAPPSERSEPCPRTSSTRGATRARLQWKPCAGRPATRRSAPVIRGEQMRHGDGSHHGAEEVGVDLSHRWAGAEDPVLLVEPLRVLRDVPRLSPVDGEGRQGGTDEHVVGRFPGIAGFAERREEREDDDQERGARFCCDMEVGVVHGQRLDLIASPRWVRMCDRRASKSRKRGASETL